MEEEAPNSLMLPREESEESSSQVQHGGDSSESESVAEKGKRESERDLMEPRRDYAIPLFLVPRRKVQSLLSHKNARLAPVPRCLRAALERREEVSREYEDMMMVHFSGVFSKMEELTVPVQKKGSKGGTTEEVQDEWPGLRRVRTSMKAASNLMTLEKCSWSGLFHLYFRLRSVTWPAPAIMHLRAVIDYFIQVTPASDDPAERAIRDTASSLRRFLYSHEKDPDGSTVGLQPSDALRLRCEEALANHPEPTAVFDWVDGKVAWMRTELVQHGDLLLAHVCAPGAATKLRFVRSVRTGKEPGSMLVMTRPLEREVTVVQVRTGVFRLPPELSRLVGRTISSSIGDLVYNPFSHIVEQADGFLQEELDRLFKEGGVDLKLASLTEQDLLEHRLDLSQYEDGEAPPAGGAAGAAQDNAKLLSLLDNERKKIMAVRDAVDDERMHDYVHRVSALVRSCVAQVDRQDVYLPLYETEVARVRAIASRSVEAMQSECDSRADHLQVMIDFLIQNWAVLSDASAKPEESQLKRGHGGVKVGWRESRDKRSGSTPKPLKKQTRVLHSRGKSVSTTFSKLLGLNKTGGENKK